MSEVPFNRVASYEEMLKPGDSMWSGSENPDEFPGRLMFICPCGCGSVAGIKVAGEHKWEWNGDFDKPTCTPSILINAHRDPPGCGWHGYLTDGVFRSC
jgi:hypothetical protein